MSGTDLNGVLMLSAITLIPIILFIIDGTVFKNSRLETGIIIDKRYEKSGQSGIDIYVIFVKGNDNKIYQINSDLQAYGTLQVNQNVVFEIKYTILSNREIVTFPKN